VVLIAIVLPITWYGGLAFRALCAVIGAAVLYEWLHMSAGIARDHKTVLGLMLAAVLVLLVARCAGALRPGGAGDRGGRRGGACPRSRLPAVKPPPASPMPGCRR
jgi:hypothetical protein